VSLNLAHPVVAGSVLLDNMSTNDRRYLLNSSQQPTAHIVLL